MHIDELEAFCHMLQNAINDLDERVKKDEDDIQDILAKFESRISALEHNQEILRLLTPGL